MFEYFPGNHEWSYHFIARVTNAAMLGGADFNEAHRTASRVKSGDFEGWQARWAEAAERNETAARQALEKRRFITARDAFLRAFTYYRTAQFYLGGTDPRKQALYLRANQCFREAAPYLDPAPQRAEIPYEGSHLSGYFYPAKGRGRPGPCVIYIGGVDIVCEELYFFAGRGLSDRGLAYLALDGPGQGESLRLRGLVSRPDYEVPIRAAYDWLLQRPDVDPCRVALIAQSMGGYYGGRAAAFEHRLRACVLWGACYSILDDLYDYYPPLRPQVEWVIGAKSPQEARQMLAAYTLKGVAGEIRCPLLITHGEKDHLVSVEAAHKTYQEARCPKTLRIWKEEEGGAEHLMNDNRSEGVPFILDWLIEQLEAGPDGGT